MSDAFGFGGIAQAIGGVVSTAMSNASSSKAQFRAFKYAKELQQHQYDLALKGYTESPSAQREGLQNAGYNPMLALGNVGNAPNVAGGTPVNANSVDTSGVRDAIASSVQLNNQTKLTEAQEDESYSQADKNKAEKATILAKLPFVGKQAKADYQRTIMETNKLENDIHYQNEYINYLRESLNNAIEVENIRAAASRYGANRIFDSAVYNANTNLEISNLHQPSGRSQSFKNYTGGARDIMSGVGDILHGRSDSYEYYSDSKDYYSNGRNNAFRETHTTSGRRKKR